LATALAGAVFAGAVFAGAVFAGAVFAGAVFAGAALAGGALAAGGRVAVGLATALPAAGLVWAGRTGVLAACRAPVVFAALLPGEVFATGGLAARTGWPLAATDPRLPLAAVM
jgi:hypothetical protein